MPGGCGHPKEARNPEPPALAVAAKQKEEVIQMSTEKRTT
jgi:hypothetical protein